MNLKSKLRHKCIFIVGFLVVMTLLCILQPVHAQYTINGENFSSLSTIQINPPSNSIFTSNNVRFDFTIESLIDARTVKCTFTYSLDGENNVTIHSKIDNIADPKAADGYKIIDLIIGSVNLRNLLQGPHSLTIFATYVVEQEQTVSFDSKTVYFTIDTMSSVGNRGNHWIGMLTDYIYLFVVVTVILIIFTFYLWRLKNSHKTQLVT